MLTLIIVKPTQKRQYHHGLGGIRADISAKYGFSNVSTLDVVFFEEYP